jgi:hypothetical protein
MFEAQRLFGTTARSIVLQTRRGTPITNEITLEPTARQISEREEVARRFPAWEHRKPATGGYNCAGHVWAARRTGIFDDFDRQVQTILADDGYRVVGPGEEPMRGDLALYWESVTPRRNLHHVGIVFEVRDSILLLPGTANVNPGRVPWVLSKPDAFSGEVLHHLNHVYFYPDAKYSVEYWTDRPPTR